MAKSASSAVLELVGKTRKRPHVISNRQQLLFVAPVMPALSGHGTAMRAGVLLEGLASTYELSLLVIPAYDVDVDSSGFAEALCRNIKVIPRDRFAAWLMNGTGPLPLPFDVSFDRVHITRLIMAPFLKSSLSLTPGTRPTYTLDFDDFESKTFERMAAADESLADPELRTQAMNWSAFFTRLENEYLPKFDRVYVCKNDDASQLAEHFGSPVQVVPNAIRVPAEIPAQPNGVFTFLFVGTMSYPPNRDAARWFCMSILPRIRQWASMPFRVLIVGANPSPDVLELEQIAEVTVTGAVPSVEPFYAESSVAVVPLRSGGGTRIKVLEALVNCRPVVSTTIGAEGLGAKDEEHLLLADTPEQFAERCLNLMEDKQGRGRVAKRGCDWVRTNYSAGRVAEIVSAPVLPSGVATPIRQLEFPEEWRQIRDRANNQMEVMVRRALSRQLLRLP